MWWFAAFRKGQLKDAGRVDWRDLDLAELRRHGKVDKASELALDEAGKIGTVYKTFGGGLRLVRLAMRETGNLSAPLPTPRSIFEPLITSTDLIMLGGDADTKACFAGALVGGVSGLAGRMMG